MSTSSSSQDSDVIVIGAGLSGLRAAHLLTEAEVGVTIVEARERVGGRTLADYSTLADYGAMWVGPTHRRVISLVEKLGMKLFDQHRDGRTVMSFGNERLVYSGLIPPLGMIALVQLQYSVLSEIDALAKQIDPRFPWASPRAEELDSITVDAWVKPRIWNERARRSFNMAIQSILCAELNQISMLSLVHYAAVSGSILFLLEGAQDMRVAEGCGNISTRLTAKLREMPKVSFALGHEVVSIAQHGETSKNDVRVKATLSGSGNNKGDADVIFSAKRVIVTAPPNLSGHWDYCPPISRERKAFCNRSIMGSVIKVFLYYAEPFWRTLNEPSTTWGSWLIESLSGVAGGKAPAAGFSGTCIGDLDPVVMAYDATSADGKQPALVCFIAAHAALKWADASEEERKGAVLRCMKTYLGTDLVMNLTGYHEMLWPTEKFAGGCYGCTMPPGSLSRLGKLARQPHGNVFWAGTETAWEFTGYMEGALQSAEYTAVQVWRSLHPDGEKPPSSTELYQLYEKYKLNDDEAMAAQRP